MSSNTQSPYFYIGKEYDPAQGKASAERVLYDPADLTTHGFVTGMTGSGKTGLCIGILEEAALQGIPAIIIDPKGDLTNLVLHFPELAVQDFAPWIDPEAARREGKTIEEMAEAAAQSWQKGLADAGLGREELLALNKSVDYAIYTPGSTSGIAVNILSSFASPGLAWEENREVLREKIASTVTALLGLVGMTDIDPLRSREHILLSNLVESSWGAGKSLNLNELILQVQTPPFERLGAFPLNNFFPEKDRFQLAVLLNNFLASPSFQVWQEGQALDIAALLHTPEGKPRHSIFYLAHLDDSERMFFVTLLFAAIETWMRGQRGSSGLRALVYFDEIMGYLPPVQNPPSRTIMLRMLKQARAFGVGLLLATQNPVDLDYKALSNAGTWMIGRLQTEQDRDRLLEGLLSADSTIDRGKVKELFNKLSKRVFLLHNVHDKNSPRLFQTRFVLNYLAGPMTRVQIPALNELAGAGKTFSPSPSQETVVRGVPASSQAPTTPPSTTVAFARADTSTEELTMTPPGIPAGINEFYLPAAYGVKEAMDAAGLTLSGAPNAEAIVYRPALLAQSESRYINRRYNLDYSSQVAALVDRKPSGLIRWEEFGRPPFVLSSLQSHPMPQAKFSQAPDWLTDNRRLKEIEKDFMEWVYRSGTIQLRANETLKVYGNPGLSQADFREMCSRAARQGMEAEQAKLDSTYRKKIASLEKKIDRQKLEVDEQKGQLDNRRVEELARGGELLLSLFGGRKKSISSSISKRRMTSKAKSDYEQKAKDLENLEKDYKELEKDYQDELKSLQEAWEGKADDISEISLTPLQKDIHLDLFGVAWRPYYLVRTGSALQEVPAF
ncbi:MAG: DUF853 family protein [Anaerolineaceae bacterium]|nr:DUF853 family protein [Anaerolineaceae bacterium]